ncbi:hypothetical protein Tco_1128790 [Tanacetum coccineum]
MAMDDLLHVISLGNVIEAQYWLHGHLHRIASSLCHLDPHRYEVGLSGPSRTPPSGVVPSVFLMVPSSNGHLINRLEN